MQTYPPGTRIGQYEIASLPMIGGMGVVYFALDHGNEGRPVALKTFRPELLPDRAARDRFLREGTAWIGLGSHPHIVRCYKVEYIDPTAFLVLELIAKEQNMPDASLRSWLIPGRPLPLEQALLFAVQIARGMQYATEKIPGFVHRDLKPENILVGADKLPGTNIKHLRVTDFGLVKTIAGSDVPAKTGNEEEIKPNQIQFTRGAGTPLYMAPEQWKGAPVGVFTDFYAFGCILYEMLSGHRVADGKTMKELREVHCEGKFRSLPLELPGDIKLLTEKCLALNSNQRFKTWDEIIVGIEHAYTAQTDRIAPRLALTTESSRAERMQVGWSFSEIGLSYLGIGKAKLAAEYFSRVLAVGREEGQRILEGAALGNLGLAYAALGEEQQAIAYYEQALVIARETGDRKKEGNALGNLGVAYKNLGNLRQAIDYFEQALKIDREMGDRRGEGTDLNNIGEVYGYLGNAQQALSSCESALKIAREIGDRRGEGNALGNLGLSYASLGKKRKAIEYHEQSLLISRAIGDRKGEGVDLGNLGNLYDDLGDTRRALACYEKALIIRREIGAMDLIASICYNMALMYARQGNIDRALPLAQESVDAFVRLGHLEYTQRAKGLVSQLQRKQSSLLYRLFSKKE